MTKTVQRLTEAASIVDLGSAPERRLGLKVHDTIVAEQNGDGGLTIRTGGWATRLTKTYINKAIDLWLAGAFLVYQERFIWYVLDRTSCAVVPFEDEMTLYPVDFQAPRIFMALMA